MLAKAGITDILITSPIVTQTKLTTFNKVLELAPDTLVVCDNLENLIQLQALAVTVDQQNINIIIDIDAGIGRTGVPFDNALSLALKAQQMKYLTLKGIQCYAGHYQHIHSHHERVQRSIGLLEKAGEIKKQLKQKAV